MPGGVAVDYGSFAIGVLVGGFIFGIVGLMIGIVFGSMANRIDVEKKRKLKLNPHLDGSVKFN